MDRHGRRRKRRGADFRAEPRDALLPSSPIGQRHPAFLPVGDALAVLLFNYLVFFDGAELMVPVGDADPTWSDVPAQICSCNKTYTPTLSIGAGRDAYRPLSKGSASTTLACLAISWLVHTALIG